MVRFGGGGGMRESSHRGGGPVRLIRSFETPVVLDFSHAKPSLKGCCERNYSSAFKC